MFKIKVTTCLVWRKIPITTGDSDRSIICSNRIVLLVAGFPCVKSGMQKNPFSQRIKRMAASGTGVAVVVFLTGFLAGCKTGDGYYDTPRNNNPAYGASSGSGGFGSPKKKQKSLQQRVDDVHAAINRQFDEE